MKHVIVPIRNNETKEVRVYEYDVKNEDEDTDMEEVYQWESGNYSCDCNRGIFFEGRGYTEDFECGGTQFTVEYITIDGVRHQIDTAELEGL